jgi:periplasmic protein TonB
VSSLIRRLDSALPFTKTERIIIAIVVFLHALPAIVELLHWTPSTTKPDDERVMANLVSPDAAKPTQQQPPAAPPPKPKQEEQKKPEPKSEQKKTPPQPTEKNQQPTQQPPAQQNQPSSSSTPIPNAAVAPATSGGASGTPIQTDIGKLIVVYQPDADAYYPSFSKRSGEQGEVVVRLIIDQAGNVEDVALLRSSNFPRLDRAAIEIGQRYRFKPFVVNGSANRISTNLLIKFNLKNN